MDAISLRNVTKGFKKNAVRREYTSFKTEFVRWISRLGKPGEERPVAQIQALRGIDLAIPRGKTVGIIGRNGSGKSTLLKLITGIYAPTEGTIEVNGRISALLDLGAGFHPDFTGRENILINGIILGMSRDEVIARTPEIIAFSELGDFIDEPVRAYSSGMFMRLAFAVATHVDPEILIVDEILAVGDEHFSRKSRAKMEEFKGAGKTILLVTHDLGTLQSWCDLAVWIDGGKIRQVGEPRLVVEAYRAAVALAEAQQAAGEISALNAPGVALPAFEHATRPEFGPVDAPADRRSGNFRGEISEVRLLDPAGQPADLLDPESPLEIELSYRTKEELSDVGFSISLLREGTELFATDTFTEAIALPSPLPREGKVRFLIDRLGFTAGAYRVDVSMQTRAGQHYDSQRGLCTFEIRSNTEEAGVCRPPHRWLFEPAVALRARHG